MIANLASNVRDIVTRLIQMLITGIFHPNVLILAAFAAVVTASYLTWGRTGALWSFAGVAFLLAIANAEKKP